MEKCLLLFVHMMISYMRDISKYMNEGWMLWNRRSPFQQQQHLLNRYFEKGQQQKILEILKFLTLIFIFLIGFMFLPL